MRSKLEDKTNKELAALGVQAYVYHVREYGEGSQRKRIRLFNAITIAHYKYIPNQFVMKDVGDAIEALRWELAPYDHRDNIQPSTWMLDRLRGMGYYGIAICDSRDEFSRKRGRLISGGRLLEHLKTLELESRGER